MGAPSKLTPLRTMAGRTGKPLTTGAAIRDAIYKSFTLAGKEKWLVKLANDNPAAYASLLSKCLPTEISSPGSDTLKASIVHEIVVVAASKRED